MVKTRSAVSVSSEPLQRLQTPPKRSRKTHHDPIPIPNPNIGSESTFKSKSGHTPPSSTGQSVAPARTTINAQSTSLDQDSSKEHWQNRKRRVGTKIQTSLGALVHEQSHVTAAQGSVRSATDSWDQSVLQLAPRISAKSTLASSAVAIQETRDGVVDSLHDIEHGQSSHNLTMRLEETPSRQTREKPATQVNKHPRPDRNDDTMDTSQQSTPLSAKRSRQAESDELAATQSASKRVRTLREIPNSNNTKPTSGAQDDMLFMFPKKDQDMDGDHLDSDTQVSSLSQRLRKDRMRKEMARTHARLGLTPRRQRLPRVQGDNPFGIETLTPLEKSVRDQTPVLQDASNHQPSGSVEEISPNAEPQNRGLFGSLRELGSAALSRLSSQFTFTATPTKAQSATAPISHTEPRRRPVPVWDIQYPDLPQSAASSAQDPNPKDHNQSQLQSESDKKRRAFDHLHTNSADGHADHAPSPLDSHSQPQSRPSTTSGADRSAADKRRARRDQLYGKSKGHDSPVSAPLFGPNSHWARGTVNPNYLEFKSPAPESSTTGALFKATGSKRAYHETLTDEQSETASEPVTASNSFRPYTESSPEDISMHDPDEPVTPVPKRQKRSLDQQPPRSAMKLPGTSGRSGRSARFNDNPVASVKRMSPVYGSSRAGVISSNNLFSPTKSFPDSNADDSIVSDPSPRTQNNTFLNQGRIHPGDLFTQALQGDLFKNVHFELNDPNDPSWKPSLANPAPGSFRLPDWDEELEVTGGDQYIHIPQASSAEAVQDTPPRPSTPRMSHAELPKPASNNVPSTPSASALEAANLERRLAEASKTKPRTASRLAEVTSARSRSPSPPPLDTDDATADGDEPRTKTPSPLFASTNKTPTWEWDAETHEFLSADKSFPDFTYNAQKELVPSFSLKSSTGHYDANIVGPDDMTESQRQAHYQNKYNDTWAEHEFAFDPPYAYESAGLGTAYIHKVIRANDARVPDLIQQSDNRFALEWNAHQKAIDSAMGQNKRLVATFPDRDGVEMLDADEL